METGQSDPVEERYCYCDDPGDPETNASMIQCGGGCERWFHQKCIKWFQQGDYLVASYDENVKLSLQSVSQESSEDEQPFLCVDCWER